MSSLSVPSHSARTLSNACWALRPQFFVAGAMFATWGIHVPTVKAHYVLGEQALAMVMLAAGLGGPCRRPLRAARHALFSLGGMVGAAGGSALPSLGISPQQHLVLAALVCSAIVVVGWTAMLRMDGPPALPRGALALIGLLAAIGLISEGAIYDWSVLFMKQELKSDASLAALAYASFSGAMAAGRFVGDAVRARLDGVRLLRLSGLVAGADMALALLVPNLFVALAGFALVGVGLSNVVPVLFSAASRVPGITPAHGIAAGSSVGYLGMMAGPPVVGVIAESSSLAAGLFIVVIFAAVLAAFAKRALP